MVKRKKATSSAIIILWFAIAVIFGSVLLCLPISSHEGEWTDFSDSFFTATSAVCVTGLTVLDTGNHWSVFGQVVILILIQTGGIGVVTFALSVLMTSGRNAGLFGKDVVKDSISADGVGDVPKLAGLILKGVFITEFLGAVIMSPVFCRDYGAKGLWLAVFHSVSAFCNAGFDLTGNFSSLTAYSADPVINLTVICLIVTGGIGFLVWDDIVKHKWRLKKYRLQSKAALAVTGILLFFPALFFFFTEFKGAPTGDRLLLSLFQSATTRTAGFNTTDLGAMRGTGLALTVVLMLIGGSSGSTAGGMKTTTVAVVYASVKAAINRKDSAELMKRRIEGATVINAFAIVFIYVFLFLTGGIAISLAEGLDIGVCLFESASALGTVGLSLGITPSLGVISRTVIIFLMFFGRIGGLTLAYAAVKERKNGVKLPTEKITVG